MGLTRRKLVPDFADEDAHGSASLLHLLTCATCRRWAIRRLLDQRTEPKEEETQGEPYAGMWARLEESAPELVEETRRRAETVDRLFEELMQGPPGRRLAMVRQARFRSLELLERLLEESHAAQLTETVRAPELARLAARLAGLFGEGDEEAAAALRSEEHTSELQSLRHLVCRLLLEQKKNSTGC